MGLENADKPQAACLSSRFPHGTAINQDLLARVEAAENVLANAGFSQFRVRHHGDVARLEILPAEFGRALTMTETLQRDIQAVGYRFVALDLGGFRSGSLNEGLDPGTKALQIPVVNLYPPAPNSTLCITIIRDAPLRLLRRFRCLVSHVPVELTV